MSKIVRKHEDLTLEQEQLLAIHDRYLELPQYLEKIGIIAKEKALFYQNHGPGAKLPANLVPSSHPEDVEAREKFQLTHLSNLIDRGDQIKRAQGPKHS